MKYFLLAVLVSVLLVSFPACTSPAADRPIVLISDFGTDDYRVPRLKGVIYSANPDAEIIDATHGIGSVDIAAGAYILSLTAGEFPENVIFIAAVGAGSTPDEKTLVVTNNKNQIFVVPDNGIITFIAMNTGIKSAYAVTNQELFDKPIAELSSHQILGKAAAMVSGGYKLEKLGAAVQSPVMLAVEDSKIAGGKLSGYVVFIDHFGSCLTNITRELAAEYGLAAGDKIKITVSGAVSNSVLGTRYNDVAVGEPVSIINSLGILQLSVNKGSFAAEYKVKTGLLVEIEKAN